MSKEYALYHSRSDFETHKAVGLFTRESLIEHVKSKGLTPAALVLESGLFGKLIEASAVDFLRLPIGPTATPETEEADTAETPPDLLAENAYRAGYAIPTITEEQRIRQRYYKARGHYRELHHPIWNDLRLATGTNMYSQNEVANFIYGASIREIFAYRLQLTGNIRSSTNGIPGKAGLPRAREAEPFSLVDAFFNIPWYVWVGGFCAIILLLAVISPNQGNNGGARNIELERAEQKARSGRGAEMTDREADAFRRKQEADAAEHRATVNAITEASQSRYSDRELEVYRYMRRRFQSYGNNYNPSIHDDLIASEAASRFGISSSEATNIYIRVDSN